MIRCCRLLLLPLLWASPALLAQGRRDGGRGDEERWQEGRREEGREEGRGEERREEGRREWRGGDFDPAGFLARMDANGNGQIDPDETEGRSGFFLRRMAENNPNLDLSKPIPIDNLSQEFARMRERREAERSGEQPREGAGGGSSGSSSNSSGAAAKKPDERLVPGFGEVQELPVVPGFGLSTNSAALVVRIVPDDRAQAQRRFDSSDDNKDGRLDQEELGSRYGEYQQYDRNKDGILTIDELSLRYATRRVDEERRRREASIAAASPASKSAGGSSTSSSSSSTVARKDRGDDRDRDDSGRGSERGGSSASRTSYSSAGGAKPYRVATSSERLAKLKLPSWYLDKDKDEDGQIAMAEFGSGSDFAKYDTNGDGLITPDECVKAGKSSSSSSRYGSSSSVARGPSPPSSSKSSEKTAEKPAEKPAEKASESATEDQDGEDDAAASADAAESTSDADGDEEAAASATPPDKSSDKPVTSDEATGESSAATTTAQPAVSQPAVPAEIPEQYLTYAQGRIKQTDANGDGLLQPDEWAKMPKPPGAADVNGDKQITAEELATFLMKQ